MSTSRPKSNPWNKNNGAAQKPKKTPQNNPHNGVAQKSSSELKFKETQSKLQNAIRKHVKDYESSSEEEDFNSTNLIDDILKQYTQKGGTSEQVARTQTFIEESFLSGAHTCLICISKVKRDDQIWSCVNCYGAFHLNCIQRWSKDTVVQQKQRIEDQTIPRDKKLLWCCPKCRFEYPPELIPLRYLCFCGKRENPEFQPFLVPHSCGEICRKDLVPSCGHQCLLLCHPGPCPPCPVTVSVPCYCASRPPRVQRCSSKGWSCELPCGKKLSCGKHSCGNRCHPGECEPCPKKSVQKCVCGAQQSLRDCSVPVWRCQKVCEKTLDCGNHKCLEVCHAGDCLECPLTRPRRCPCKKTEYRLPCTVETPSCSDTCDKILDCGSHSCSKKCHKDECGYCLEIVKKVCRCGQHSKDIQCYKPYFCETKCKKIRDCTKHPCNRKCCDGNCPPCEKPCGHTLQCGNHKCPSVCHRGPCYPCQLTHRVSCRCGATQITVPCGRKHRVKPPKCLKLCTLPPDCHHQKRVDHRCHVGDCPPCRQICNKSRSGCLHLCGAPCHSSVLVKTESDKASMPWEQSAPRVERKSLPCPDCIVPVMVTCLGGHETIDWPCHTAKPTCCGRACGRILDCQNHFCSLLCHTIEESTDSLRAGANCEKCENPCSKARPEGCVHSCPKACHPGSCPPCKQLLRIKCHCGLNQPYIQCSDWSKEERREELQSCGNQCPKNYSCGHRCKSNCHSGKCPNEELCKKKIKISCKCKRLKKEFQCELVAKGMAAVDCDEVCKEKQEEERIIKEAASAKWKKEEEEKNRKELEQYEKKLYGKKKNRDQRVVEEEEEDFGFIRKYWSVMLALFVVVLGLVTYHALS